jgi:hypothetical protein
LLRKFRPVGTDALLTNVRQARGARPRAGRGSKGRASSCAGRPLGSTSAGERRCRRAVLFPLVGGSVGSEVLVRVQGKCPEFRT